VCALCGNMLRRERDDHQDAEHDGLGLEARRDERTRNFEQASRDASLLAVDAPDPRFDALRALVPRAPVSHEVIRAPASAQIAHAENVSRSVAHVDRTSDSIARDDRATGSMACADRASAPMARDHRASSFARGDRASEASHEPWLYLGIGLLTAPVFALTPLLEYMGWFLASLVHEMGHAAFAWLCGMPAVPAIALDGHAAAVHSEQSLFLVALIALGLGAGAWNVFTGRVRWIALALLAIVYPAIALTSAKELFHLLAGHGGELAFATLCLWKTLDGGFTDSKLERALYGMLGWFLLGKNVHMCFGLMHSADARAEYNDNGSFGLTNDYIRVAEDVLHCPLERVALMMLVAALLVLPAALGLWRVSRAMRSE